jgi:hypothetical protein
MKSRCAALASRPCRCWTQRKKESRPTQKVRRDPAVAICSVRCQCGFVSKCAKRSETVPARANAPAVPPTRFRACAGRVPAQAPCRAPRGTLGPKGWRKIRGRQLSTHEMLPNPQKNAAGRPNFPLTAYWGGACFERAPRRSGVTSHPTRARISRKARRGATCWGWLRLESSW